MQRVLSHLYDLDLEHAVEDFVCDRELASLAAGDVVERREVLLVLEEPDDISVGLYVDPLAVAALEETGAAWLEDCLEHGRFEAFCLAAEGVSHFVYLMFRLGHEQSVSQLELEVQAEVDKYATGLLVGNGVGAIQARSRELRRRLFTGVRYVDGPHTEAGARYRTATKVAATYTASLERHFVDTGELAALARELRRFYRRGARGKLEESRLSAGRRSSSRR